MKWKENLFLDGLELTFHPVVTSTQIDLAKDSTSPKQQLNENVNNFEQNDMGGSVNVVESNQSIWIIESTSKDEPTKKKRKRTDQSENVIKENDDRLNRTNFFLKNITTSKTYLDVFIFIATLFPFTQQNVDNRSAKIRYLCVAGNFFSI